MQHTISLRAGVRWLASLWWNQHTKVQILDLAWVVAFSWIYFRTSGDVRSVGGGAPVNYEGVCSDFVNLKMMCRLSLSEVLIGIE